MKKKKKVDEKRLGIKMLLCLAYLIIITILFVGAYKMFEEKSEILSYSEVHSVKDYSYIEVSKMSEKFAYYEDTNIGIHFVIEKEETGIWHTYLIAINEMDYDRYKSIIDYTYERTEEVPKPMKVYGYPTIIDDNIKNLAIKNIGNFVPAENEVQITAENYETYLTNCYLDTTMKQKDEFSISLCITLLLLFTVVGLLIITIFDRDKIVDNIDGKLEEEIAKTRKMLKIDEKKRKSD